MCEAKIWAGLFLVAFMVIGVIFMAILIVARNSIQDSNFEFIQELGENWSNGPIINLSVSRTAICPSGYLPFIRDRWPGTVAGCKCIAISRGFCNRSRNHFQRFCTDISPIPPIPFNYYDGYQICRQKTSAFYLELNLSSGRCPSSAPKDCGLADSLENSYCIKSGQECPVNDIKFLKLASPTPAGYKSLNLSSRKIVYTNTKTSSKLPIITKISDEQPCIDPGEENYTGQTFILDYFHLKNKCRTSINNSQLDTKYQKIDTYYYYDLLNENNIIAMLKRFPKYPPSRLNHDTNLYVKNYIGMKPECKPQLMETIGNNAPEFTQNLLKVGNTAQDAAIIGNTAFILSIVTFVLFLIWGIMATVCFCTCMDRAASGSCWIQILIWGIIAVILTIVTMGFAGAFSSKINNIGNAHVLLQGCMDKE
ncbi:MAG: hypothetical protein GY861_19265, partial [bacterium]|nr:hypothetical protein [bacterium]